jgi:hypothetical protein
MDQLPAIQRIVEADDACGDHNQCFVSQIVIRCVHGTSAVRLDDEAPRALSELEATGMSRSEAIRAALVTAASRLRDNRALAAEVAALEADEDDRAEMLAVAELMEILRASG